MTLDTFRRKLSGLWIRPVPPSGPWPLLGALVLTLAATAAACFLRRPDSFGAAFAVYLLELVLVAFLWGHAASAASGVLSLLCWDLFLETPPWSLAISDWPVFLDFTAMVATALVVATLVDRLRDRLVQIETLNVAARALLGAETPAEVGQQAEETSTHVLGATWRIVPDGDLRRDSVPLVGSSGALGRLAPCAGAPRPASRELVTAFAAQVALALERARLAERAHGSDLAIQEERTRSSLLAALGHDLRTPMAGITGAASSLLLADSGLTESARSEMIALIARESRRLSQLVDNLLDLTRLDAGSIKPRLEWQPIEEVVGSARARFEAWFPKVIFLTEIDDSIQAPLDEVLIEQVLLNLLENAVRHGRPEGPLSLSARRNRDVLELEIGDRGPGIHPMDAAGIFEPFVAGPHSHGSGLGLAVCRAIARIHGGSLEYFPRNGGGSVFLLSLPCPDPPDREDPP
jgi:two-component system sensor histidine kinase KdpD